VKRLEVIVRELNVCLLALAIGLGALDATVFFAFKLPAIAAERASDARDRDRELALPNSGVPMTFWLE
jgi:hypothetical protein